MQYLGCLHLHCHPSESTPFHPHLLPDHQTVACYTIPRYCGMWLMWLSWYNLPSPSLPTSGCLRPHPPPLHSIPLRKVNTCKYLPIGSIIILQDDVYKSSKIMLPKKGLCL